MRQILYSLQFRGHATALTNSPNVLKASTTAVSCAVITLVDANGLSGSIQPAGDGVARFESEVMFTGDAAFQERGAITFGEQGHRLRFSTVGQGYLSQSPDPTLKHGTVMWQVDGGEGQFAGARGLITSNFSVSDTGAVVDHHFGLLFVEEQ